MKKTTGVVIGKFMPLHKGHEYLINFARHCVDELTILVDNLPDSVETMTLEARVRAVQETFPTLIVKGIDVVTYQEPEDAPDFWEFWRDTMIRNIGYKPDYIIGSMDYIKPLAEVIGCEYIMSDKERVNVPVSATIIRNAMANYLQGDRNALDTAWGFISEASKDYFTRHIYVVGGESCGKSTLSQNLALDLKASLVTEYARILIEEQNGHIEEKDMKRVAIGQRGLQEINKRGKGIFCIHDTDLITTKIWHEKLYGSSPEWIESMIKEQPDGLYILLKPVVKWEADIVRFFPGQTDRELFHEAFKRELASYNKNVIELEVSGSAFNVFCAAVKSLSVLGLTNRING